MDTDKSRAKSLFDWDYISAKDSIVDTANQLSAMDKSSSGEPIKCLYDEVLHECCSIQPQ